MVIGPKVDQVFAAIKEILGEQTAAPEATVPHGSWANRLLATLSAIFTPNIGVLAGVGQLFVVFGVLWGIIPLALINIQVNGYDTIMAMFMSAVMGQFGAAFGAIFIALNLKDKQIAISASFLLSLVSPNLRCMA